MLRKSLHLWFAALGWVAVLVPTAAIGQTPAMNTGTAGKPASIVEAKTIYRGARYEPSNRPDPFLNPLLRKKGGAADEEVPRGTPPPGIAGMYSNEVELLGMSLATAGKTAVFKGTDKRVYFLREGDRLFDGYIKAINIDSVLLIRETKLRSGKVLTQEITKRLRT